MNGYIYKITSIKNRVYIGQTINFKVRFNKYKRLDCKNQKKLYNSLLKYGIEKHTFEIICECDINDLNDKERYYQDLYNSTSKFGLNIRLTKSTDRNGSFSDESKRKMAEAKIGKNRSPEVKKAISEKMKEIAKERSSDYYKNFSKANVGRKHTEEHKQKNSNAKKGNNYKKNKKLTDEQRNRISQSKNGTTYRKNTDM